MFDVIRIRRPVDSVNQGVDGLGVGPRNGTVLHGRQYVRESGVPGSDGQVPWDQSGLEVEVGDAL